MADVLEGGRAPESIAQNWQAWHEIYAAQDVRARATLTMGFVQLADLWPLDPAPDLADAAMTDGPAIRTELIALAREMPDTVLYHVAHADYGYLAGEHLTALRDVLARPESWRTRDGTTDEVIGLISHVPGQTGFAGCTALMLIDTTNYGDRYGDMDFRWANNAATYLDMPPPTGAPVLAGFRLLYETDEDWNPYGVSEYIGTEHLPVVIPPCAQRFLMKDTQ